MAADSEITSVTGRALVPGPFAMPTLAPRLPRQVRVVSEIPTDTDVLVVACGSGKDDAVSLRPGVADACASLGVDLVATAEQVGFTGAVGAYRSVPVAQSGSSINRLVMVGVGRGTVGQLRTAGGAAFKALKHCANPAIVAVSGCDDDVVAAFVEGMVLGAYRSPRAGEQKPDPEYPTTVTLLGQAPQDVVDRAVVMAQGTVASRELCAMPSSIKTTAWLADQAELRASKMPHTSVKRWKHQDLVDGGFGGLLAVGGASEVPPEMVQISYDPPGATEHVVLVGKGIVFDTGGISLKPSDAMLLMRTDMSGSATVLHATLAAAELGLPVKVTTLMALAENCFDGDAYRPADVVTTWGGHTVEISNTDAEGRMVLADALAYAASELNPDVMVDVATLTGAATMALGRTHAASFTRDAALQEAMAAAGRKSGEQVWPMPLQDSYRYVMDSFTADIRHTADEGTKVGAGATLAALFLEHFVDDTPWLHLDIAGPGRAESDNALCPSGPTGFGVRLLTEWLASR